MPFATLLPLAMLLQGQFTFNPAKIEKDVIYRYIRSNQDGTQEEHVDVRPIATGIEGVKYLKTGAGARVIAEMDWQKGSAKKLDSWRVGTGTPFKIATLTDANGKLDVNVMAVKKQETKPSPAGTWILYNFDLCDLMAMLPHLSDPKGKLKFEVWDPNFQEGAELFQNKGPAEMKYVSDEQRLGFDCRKYEVSGQAFGSGGNLWVSKRHNMLVEARIATPNHPGMKDFKLQLVKREKLTDEQYQAWLKKRFGAL